MRLIDADALPVHKAYCVDEAGWGANVYVVDGSDIDKAPTIDPETLRPTGRWITTIYTTTSKRGRVISNQKFACSECGYNNGRKQSNYCPNCGAKMMEE